MKNTMILLAWAILSCWACGKEGVTDTPIECCPVTCWGRGTLDTLDCSCQCGTNYGGPECDSLLFQQATALRFDTYKLDYMETAASGDVVEVDCIKHIKKGSNPTRQFRFTNVTNGPVLIKDAKGSTGALVPSFPKDPIEAGGSGVIQVSYDVKRVGEKLAWIEVITSHGEYRLMVKVRVVD